MILLDTDDIQIRPFQAEEYAKLRDWFYDLENINFFRHHPRIYKDIDFSEWPRIISADVFSIYSKSDNKHIGIVQVSGDTKTNRACFLGILIDKNYRQNRIPTAVFALMLDYCFNRLGFRKAIVEVLSSHTKLIQTLERTGFIHEGNLRGECFMNGQFVDETRYCMFSEQFNLIMKSE